MLRKRSGSVEWLEFELFQNVPHFVHGVFLRHGGVSEGEFSSLNLAFVDHDRKESIIKNIEIVQNVLGLSYLYLTKQRHTSLIHEVKGNQEVLIPPCDGMLTKEVGFGLLINHADCQAAIFLDPIKRICANVHAGWRGNVQNIYKEAVEKFKLAGSSPENLLVGISPSLGPDASQFINYRTEFPESFWDFQFKPDYFNLWEIARWQLEETGILPHHIEIAQTCTYSHPQDFFSYRRVKKSGRHGTVAGFLKP